MSARPETAIPSWIEALNLPGLMTPAELAKVLRISPAQAYRIAHAIPGTVHLGRSVRIPGSSIARWLAGQQEHQP